MKVINVATTISIPLDDLVDAVGPEVVRILRAKEEAKKGTRAVRPPILALHEAAKQVSKALDDYEAAQFSAGERGSVETLIAASKGLRTAYRNFKNQI